MKCFHKTVNFDDFLEVSSTAFNKILAHNHQAIDLKIMKPDLQSHYYKLTSLYEVAMQNFEVWTSATHS